MHYLSSDGGGAPTWAAPARRSLRGPGTSDRQNATALDSAPTVGAEGGGSNTSDDSLTPTESDGGDLPVSNTALGIAAFVVLLIVVAVIVHTVRARRKRKLAQRSLRMHGIVDVGSGRRSPRPRVSWQAGARMRPIMHRSFVSQPGGGAARRQWSPSSVSPKYSWKGGGGTPSATDEGDSDGSGSQGRAVRGVLKHKSSFVRDDSKRGSASSGASLVKVNSWVSSVGDDAPFLPPTQRNPAARLMSWMFGGGRGGSRASRSPRRRSPSRDKHRQAFAAAAGAGAGSSSRKRTKVQRGARKANAVAGRLKPLVVLHGNGEPVSSTVLSPHAVDAHVSYSSSSPSSSSSSSSASPSPSRRPQRVRGSKARAARRAPQHAHRSLAAATSGDTPGTSLPVVTSLAPPLSSASTSSASTSASPMSAAVRSATPGGAGAARAAHSSPPGGAIRATHSTPPGGAIRATHSTPPGGADALRATRSAPLGGASGVVHSAPFAARMPRDAGQAALSRVPSRTALALAAIRAVQPPPAHSAAASPADVDADAAIDAGADVDTGSDFLDILDEDLLRSLDEDDLQLS